MTYKYQPLDTTVNGILKNKMTKSYSKFIAKNIDQIYSYKQCMKDFLLNMKEIKKGTIIKAFNCLRKFEK